MEIREQDKKCFCKKYKYLVPNNLQYRGTVKLGNKERFDKERIGIKEPIPWPIFYSLHKDKEHLAFRNNFRATKKFLIAMFDCISKYSCL